MKIVYRVRINSSGNFAIGGNNYKDASLFYRIFENRIVANHQKSHPKYQIEQNILRRLGIK